MPIPSFPSVNTGLVKKGPSGENAFFQPSDAASVPNAVKNCNKAPGFSGN